MRRTASSSILLAFALLPLLPLAVEGQPIPSPYSYIERRQEAGVFIGVMDGATGRFGYGPKGGTVYGGRWGIELAGPLSFEGVASVIDGERDLINPRRDEGSRDVGDADVLISAFDARFKFSLPGRRAWHRLSPFLVAGGGIAFDLAGTPAGDEALEADERFDFGTSFMGTAGAGTRWFVTESVALRVDGVFSLWRLSTPPGFSDPVLGFTAVEETEWVRGLSLTVSGLFRW